MSRLSDVQAFIDASRDVRSPDDLHRLMQGISREMGFDHFALVHHVDLRPIGKFEGQAATSDFVALSDYPQAWMDQYVNDVIVSNDPILMASQRSPVGFEWNKVETILKLTSAQQEIMDRTHEAGLSNGFTVPANVPGELNGSCNFACATGRDVPSENFFMAQLVGGFAFQSARELIARLREIPKATPVHLTGRQLECIVLVARGKTDWEIGKILGISEETVKRYMKDAREAYDVPKRVQVVMRALFDGKVPLTELIQ